ncbi:MAG: FixH family protein [Rhodobacteraceae bacterium]|nr:FixH family protein [Paracoccaceae bacterium]
MSSRELTGRKVLIITVSAFAVVIGVNLTLAFQAVSTFPGLEVKNSYVASQEFNELRNAQVALGWTLTAEYDAEVSLLRLRFVGEDGRPADVAELALTIGRATQVKDDQTPKFEYYNGVFSAPVTLEPGYWNLRLSARSRDGTEFRQRVQLFVEG